MNDIPIHFGQKEFLLNNNSDKYNRAKNDAGKDATEFEILAYYDKLGGLVQDKEGAEQEKGKFWSAYEKWKTEGEKMIKMLDENINDIHKTEAQLLILLNENISHKRGFLGTLMTIATAIVAGLFFVFSTDFFSGECELFLAKTGGLLYVIFIFSSGFWLTSILGQESSRLDKKMKFYQDLPEEMYKKIGKEIKSEKAFNDYLGEKLVQSKALDTKIYGDKEYYFYIICGLFLLASLPIVVLFLIK